MAWNSKQKMIRVEHIKPDMEITNPIVKVKEWTCVKCGGHKKHLTNGVNVCNSCSQPSKV